MLSMNTYRWISCAWLRVMLLAALTGTAIHIPLSLQAQIPDFFVYEVVSTSVRITGYTGTGGAVVIPTTINGMPVTEIGVSAFWGKITDPGSTLTLSQNIVKLGQGAFGNCTGLSGTIVIPAGLATIEDWIFIGNSDISAFSVNAANPNFSSIDGVLFDKTTTRLIRCPPQKTGSYSIPPSVISIDPYAFQACSRLTGPLVIPSALGNIEEGVFKDCSGFTGSLTIPDGIGMISEAAFSGCSGFDGTLTLPDSLTIIDYFAFTGCSGFIGNLTLPPNLTQIRTAAFQDCSGFNGILTIPASTHTIRENGFKNCSGFTRAHFQGNAPTIAFDTFEGMGLDFTFVYNRGATGFTTPVWYGYPCYPTPPILFGIGSKSVQTGQPIVFTIEAENNGPRLTYSASGSNPP